MVTYSNDGGRTWEEYVSAQLVSCQDIAFGNGTFVAVGSSQIFFSTDNARTWTTVNVSTAYWARIAFGNDTFVAFGTNYPDRLMMYSTDNGQTWSGPVVVPGVWSDIAFGNDTFVMIGYQSIYSTDNGQSWSVPINFPGIYGFYSIAFGNDTFVAVGQDSTTYSTDNGQSWSAPLPSIYVYESVTFGNGIFVAVSSFYAASYSSDNGQTWTTISVVGNWYGVAFGDTAIVNIPGDGLKNLHVVGSKIYASSNSSTVSSVVEIDTSADLNNPSAYKYYSSTDSTAPITFDGTAPKIFANGPRFVYMFTQGNSAATNIIRFDPYPPTPLLKTSLLVDYESLPEGIKKPDKALIGLVQTQKILDMTNMDIHGPVKELWVTGPSAASNVFQYSNLATRSTLELAGERIVTDDDGTHTFLNIIEPFETHTSMPLRNVSVVSFEFDPESEVPNGTINFSRIRDQVFEGDAETIWARNYNILAIQGGTGGLIFNS